MTKKRIRCYKVFAQVSPGVYNYPVYLMIYEGWSLYSLCTCINCAELFVIDWENSATKGLSINQVAAPYSCPNCGALLEETVREYRKTIRLQNDNLGTYQSEHNIPEDDETIEMEFYELIPRK